KRHHSSSRDCGGSLFIRSMASQSISRLAINSNARSRPLPLSLSTSSSPRRNISSSLPRTRNSFGKRTAWLFPDLKTRATAMGVSSVYTSLYIHYCLGSQLPRHPLGRRHHLLGAKLGDDRV